MNSSRPVLLSAESLSFSYNGHKAIDGVSLELRAGDFLGITGPNGSGKSTLLKLLTGLLKPQEGTAQLCGRPLPGFSAQERAALMGALPPEQETLYGFSVLETALMGRMLAAPWWKDADAASIAEAENALRAVGLGGLEHRPLTSLSSGERQRAFLAQALCVKPKILVLDEPTSHLDLKHSLEIMRLLRGLTDGGLAVAAVLHDLNAVAEHCSGAILLADGRLLSAGAPQEALNSASIESAYGVSAHKGESAWRFSLKS